jgi:RimJ/RimL family protein N-acetyltransferase
MERGQTGREEKETMSNRQNKYGQPIGAPLDVTLPRPHPPHVPLHGQYCELLPADPDAHAEDLFAAFNAGEDSTLWTYMAYGPFADLPTFRDWMRTITKGRDPLFYAIVVDGKPLGLASYLRIDPGNGVIEVGYITYAPALQRTRAATEAMYLMMRHAFEDLGYRRYEWKCDDLNAPSRRAAARLGFTYEGTFRKATHYKSRTRDTAWFSIIDSEWPARKAAFEAWLNPDNFDADGKQKQPLKAF